MSRTKWIIFVVLAVAILGGLVWVSKSNVKTFRGDATQVITEGPIADHMTGSADKKVVLIEYGDYQCPGCAKYNPVIKQITAKYMAQLTFVFRNIPLSNIHPNALAAAAAVEAAGLQGKYFEMNDILYTNQSAWSEASVEQRGQLFETYAKSLGLDIDKFRIDISSQDVNDKIDRDKATAKLFNVDSTPTFILNGEKIPSDIALDPTALEDKIKQAIKNAYSEVMTTELKEENAAQ